MRAEWTTVAERVFHEIEFIVIVVRVRHERGAVETPADDFRRELIDCVDV